MLLKYIYDDRLAQASYLLGCPASGEALVIDPARDISPYLKLAADHGLRIVRVAETHIHADYVSGGRELAARTSALLHLSGHGEAPLAYDFSDVEEAQVAYVCAGDHFMVGGVRVDVIHTPGHTPEHIAFLVTDTGADHPIGLFSGDCLFVGDVGRPDLLDATGMTSGTSEVGARQQFESIRLLADLPDYLQVWPGHGAGSACGKALGAVPSTTIGYEKLFNPAFQHTNPDSFTTWLLDGQPDAPRYFAQMKRLNRSGAPLLRTLKNPRALPGADLPALVGQELIIDTRPGEEYAAHHLPGTLHIPSTSRSFSTYVGWYVNYDRPLYLIAAKDDLPRLLSELRAIGVDDIPGYFPPATVEGAAGRMRQITPQEAAQLQNIIILDVRGGDEHKTSHIPGSWHVQMGRIEDYLPDLPHDRSIITQCSTGVRSQIAASILQNHGFDVVNMQGGIDAWTRAGLPLERG